MSMRYRFAQSAPTGTYPAWGTVNLTGTYPTLSAQEDYTVLTPNGDSPTEAALASHRYHHHTRVAVGNGRVWVGFSSSGTNEDAGGQMALIASSPLQATLAFGAPIAAVPAQSTWSGTGASYDAGSRTALPRIFVEYGGTLYLVAGINDELGGGDNCVGAALVAVECKTGGTLGTLFRITSQTYTPKSGFPAIDYDATLGPPIYAQAKLFGIHGGSSPGNTASDWPSWVQQSSVNFTHPVTIAIDGETRHIRLWRRVTSPDNYLWGQVSTDGGSTFGTLSRTSIPDAPSGNAAVVLSDGRIAMVGNPMDVSTVRDPLYLAIFEGTSKARLKLYAVRQDLSDTPTYAGTNKSGAAAYPGLWEDSGKLYVSYSMQKETVGMTRFNLSDL